MRGLERGFLCDIFSPFTPLETLCMFIGYCLLHLIVVPAFIWILKTFFKPLYDFIIGE